MLRSTQNPTPIQGLGDKVKMVNKKGESPDPLQSKEMVDFLISVKKTKHKEFLLRQGLFSSIGLLTSLSLTIGLFEWKAYNPASQVELQSNLLGFEEIMDIPITEQPPPPPPSKRLEQPDIIEVSDEEIIEEIELDFDVEITEETAFEDLSAEWLDEPVPEEEVDEIFTIVEKNPEPPGGMIAFLKFVSGNIKYPQYAIRNQVQGKVFVEFVVNTDGSLGGFKILKGIGGGCDEEAIRVLESAPKWAPGKQRGKPVRVRMVIPITFVFRSR